MAELYGVLGLPPPGTEEGRYTATQIRKAYRKQALKLHPDRCSATDAEQQFHQLRAAYEALSDDSKRAEYDAQLLREHRRQQVVDASFKAKLEKAHALKRREAESQTRARPPQHTRVRRHVPKRRYGGQVAGVVNMDFSDDEDLWSAVEERMRAVPASAPAVAAVGLTEKEEEELLNQLERFMTKTVGTEQADKA